MSLRCGGSCSDPAPGPQPTHPALPRPPPGPRGLLCLHLQDLHCGGSAPVCPSPAPRPEGARGGGKKGPRLPGTSGMVSRPGPDLWPMMLGEQGAGTALDGEKAASSHVGHSPEDPACGPMDAKARAPHWGMRSQHCTHLITQHNPVTPELRIEQVLIRTLKKDS